MKFVVTFAVDGVVDIEVEAEDAEEAEEKASDLMYELNFGQLYVSSWNTLCIDDDKEINK